MYYVTYRLHGESYEFREMTREQALDFASDASMKGAIRITIRYYPQGN